MTINKIALVLLPIAGILISPTVPNQYLTLYISLLWAIPGIYLAIKHRQSIKLIGEVLLFSIVISIPFAIIVDFVGIQSNLWQTTNTLFPQRFLDIIAYEDFIWLISAVFTLNMLYQTIFYGRRVTLLNKRLWYFILPALGIIGVFFLLIARDENTFSFTSQYTYLILASTFFLLPAILFFWKHLQLLKRCWTLIPYFLYLTLLLELTATFLGQWIFTGSYFLPPLQLSRTIIIPYEELFFIGIVGPMTVVAFYETFSNKKFP